MKDRNRTCSDRTTILDPNILSWISSGVNVAYSSGKARLLPPPSTIVYKVAMSKEYQKMTSTIR
jgi:hypothetical protein